MSRGLASDSPVHNPSKVIDQGAFFAVPRRIGDHVRARSVDDRVNALLASALRRIAGRTSASPINERALCAPGDCVAAKPEPKRPALSRHLSSSLTGMLYSRSSAVLDDARTLPPRGAPAGRHGPHHLSCGQGPTELAEGRFQANGGLRGRPARDRPEEASSRAERSWLAILGALAVFPEIVRNLPSLGTLVLAQTCSAFA